MGVVKEAALVGVSATLVPNANVSLDGVGSGGTKEPTGVGIVGTGEGRG